MRELWLVRHAESTANAAGILQGWAEYALSEHGVGQAARVAGRLADLVERPSIVSSPLERARRTAEAIAAATGGAIAIDDRWREYDFGPLTGLTHDEIAARFPAVSEAWRQGRARDPLPGEEGPGAFGARVAAALEELLAAGGDGHRVIVAHGGSLDALVRNVVGVPIELRRVFSFANASISRLTVEDFATARRYRIASLNDTAHL